MAKKCPAACALAGEQCGPIVAGWLHDEARGCMGVWLWRLCHITSSSVLATQHRSLAAAAGRCQPP